MKREGIAGILVMGASFLVVILLIVLVFTFSPPRSVIGGAVVPTPSQVFVQLSLNSVNLYGVTVTANPTSAGLFSSPIIYATLKGIGGAIVATASYNFGTTYLTAPQQVSMTWISGPLSHGSFILILFSTDQSGNPVSSTTSNPVTI